MDHSAAAPIAGTRSLAARLGGVLVHAWVGVLLFGVQLIQATSFAALVFGGDLVAGFGMGLSAALVGIAVVGAIVAPLSTVKPLSVSVDTPSLAVSAILAAGIGARAIADGFSGEEASVIVLLALTVSTVVSGLLMLSLGGLRLGRSLRFVPFAVVSGFLGATGWLVIAGGLWLVGGRVETLRAIIDGTAPLDAVRLAIAFAFAVTLRLGARLIRSPLFLPGFLAASAAAIDVALWQTGGGAGWFLAGSAAVAPWVPLRAALSDGQLALPILLASLPGIITLSVVTLISVVVKYATVELSGSRPVDLDRELVAHGIANSLAAPLGGLFMCLNLSTNQLLRVTGVMGYGFSLAAAFAIGVFLVSGASPGSYVPTPLLAGLLMFLGFNLLNDALRPLIVQRSWLELAITLAILLVCVLQGYIVGVLAGLAVSCLIFAASYARISVIRRHLTGESLIGRSARPQETIELLRREAGGVHAFWLSGYLFFGSSEQVFDRVRAVVERTDAERARFIILDFTDVPGADASARASIAKLKGFCGREGVTLIFSGLGEGLRDSLARGGIVGAGEDGLAFPDYGRAIAWCETKIIATDHDAGSEFDDKRFLAWLAREVGGEPAARELMKHLARIEFSAGEVIYRAGDASDSIGFVAEGSVEVRLPGLGSASGLERQVMGSTVIGEMGFFRRKPRGATVIAETPAVIYVLERERMRELERSQPYLATAICRYIIRELSERLETANVDVGLRR